MQSISFNDVSQKAKKHKKKLQQTLVSVLTSGVFLNGKQTNDVEKILSKRFSHRFALTVSSGHDALLLSLLSLQLSSTDEVFFPVNSYPTAFPIVLSGAKPVPIDVDKNGQLSVDEVKKRITKHTKVLVLVHMYGMTTDIKAFQHLAKIQNIVLIEDCAQAFGTMFEKMPVGTFGEIGCFSFYPTKNVGTLGDGGAIITQKKDLYHHIRNARSYGEQTRYKSLFVSGHSRLAELQAGFLSVYLKTFEKELEKRKKMQKYYLTRITDSTTITPLQSHVLSSPALHLFVVRAKKRDQLMHYLQKKNIPTAIHYPTPIHLVSAFSYLGYKKGDFPQAESLAKEIVSLPFHPSLSKLQINYIIRNIENFYST